MEIGGLEMRIHDLRSEATADRTRVAATVVWEDCDREPQEVHYDTTPEFADDLTCDPHAFLVGAILPAIRQGEQRIFIDAPICPGLRNGLKTAIGWFQKWSLLGQSIRIEAGSAARYPKYIAPRAGSFLSGGVDSLALIRVNRLDYPQDHPGAFRDSLFVHGFDIGGLADSGSEMPAYQLAWQAASAVAQDAGTRLIPVFTNVRHLYDEVDFWIYQFHGAALASVAHAFSNRLSCVSIASACNISNLSNKTTHPLIEANYSSANLKLKVGSTLYSRLERVNMISDWQVALDNLRVCTLNPPGKLNCGGCEKCIRTMLQLLVSGSLDKTGVFGEQHVHPDMLERIHFTGSYQEGWYADLIAPLTAQGHRDLADIIQRKRREYQKRTAWEQERDWKGIVKRFDRRWLSGKLYTTYQKIRR